MAQLGDGADGDRRIIEGATNRVRVSVRLAHRARHDLARVVRVSSTTRSDSRALEVHTLRPVTR
jgi:hypothetical protein